MTKKTHTVIGLALGLYLATPQHFDPTGTMAAAALCSVTAVAPDLDIKLGLKHRGITHSVFALVALLVLCLNFAPTLAPYAAGGYASHILSDMLTVYGVPLFYPNPNRFRFVRFRTGGTADRILRVLLSLNALWLIYDLFRGGH